MRPDDRRRRKPQPTRAPADGRPIPFAVGSDPGARQLAKLKAELATTGARLRTQRRTLGPDRPDPRFAAALRTQLVGTYPAVTAAPVAPSEPPRPRPVARSSLWFGGSGLRWAAPALAAAFVIAVIGSIAGGLLPTTFDARAADVVDALLIRAGTATTLSTGTILQPGDEIRVGPDGRATLELAASLARLEGGTDLRLADLAPDRVRLELVSGRSYHRVSLDAGGTYVVATGPISWTAHGTAFDISREPSPDGADRITLLGLEHSVDVAGPNLRATVGEGRQASLSLGGGVPSDLDVGPIEPARFDDPWLAANARQDRAGGYPLGVLDEVVDPAPSPTDALVAPDVGPADGPRSTPGSSPAATTGPDALDPTDRIARTTPKPDRPFGPDATPRPTPKPAPPAVLALRLTSCDGGVVIDWSRYRGVDLDRYVTLRSPNGSIVRAYPPRAGARLVAGSSVSDRWRTSAMDASGEAGATYAYRTMALGPADRVIGASRVETVVAKAVRDLGAMTVGPGDGATTVFGWNPYEGSRACFSRYAISWSRDDPTPSALDGAKVAFVSRDKGASEALIALAPGTYHFRLEALRATGPGSGRTFVVARSEVATYTVP